MSKIVLICIGLLAFTTGLNAQSTNSYWEEVKNPDGGYLYTTMVTNDGICYNYFYDGGPVYRSANKGESWEKIVLPYWGWDTTLVIGPKGDFYRVCQRLTPQPKYALNHSTDLGKTWVSITEDFPGVYLSQMRSGTLLAIQTNDTKKIFRSTDGGKTWALSASGGQFDNNEITDWGNGLLMTHNLSKRDFTYYSIDDGQSWSIINISLSGNTYDDIFLTKGLDTFFVARGLSLYRSYDRGGNWIQVFSQNTYIQDVFKTPSGKIFIIDDYGKYFVSEDNGSIWVPFDISADYLPATITSVFNEQQILGLGKHVNAFVRSDNGGKDWELATKGLDQATIQRLAFVTDSIMFAITSTSIARSDDSAHSWDNLRSIEDNVGLSNKHHFAALNADTIAVLDGIDSVYISTDGGKTFISYYINMTYGIGIFFHPTSKRLILNNFSTIYYSDNLGANWQLTQPVYGTLEKIKVHPSGNLFGFSTKDGQFLCVNPDNFSGKIVTPPGFDPDYSAQFAIGPNGEIYYCKYFLQSKSYKLAISKDEGATWVVKTLPQLYAEFNGFALEVNALGNIFMSVNNKLNNAFEMITSSDQGDSWLNVKIPIKATDRFEMYLFLSPDGHLYASVEGSGLYRSAQSTHIGGFIRGKIQKDADAECSTPDAQDPLKWPVTIEGEQTFYVSPNALTGKYEAFVPDTGSYDVSVKPSNAVWWDVCDPIQTLYLGSSSTADTANFAALALMDCALMQVDVSAIRLRRCFDNKVYVHYCNIGGEAADSAYVDLDLDPYLTLISANLAYTTIAPNTYRFQLGKVLAEACGDFQIVVNVDCDSTVLGQTHCIEAHAWPDTLCDVLPLWSGANIEANATCLGDSIRLSLKNNSPFQSQSLEYIIVEDDVVLRGAPKQYGPFEEMNIVLPAQGRTMRIESKQEPNHPFSTLALAFKEGCNGFSSLGFVNQFAVNGSRPAYDVFCAQNVGAYDPNDKTGFPLGYGPQNRIRPGQDLEYMIRFQNTGTDTAFTVVIRDTLSEWLDPASVVPGASSHKYTWSLSGNGVLTLRFDQIMLPDSNKNLAASQGFVTFKIQQAANVPLGSKIFNKAEIYFDFNAPIVTNQTLHIVQIQQVTNTVDLPSKANNSVSISPNPMHESTIIRLQKGVFNEHQITLTDMLGRVVQQQRVSGSQYVVERRAWVSGVYGYRVENKRGDLVGVGKLVVD